MISLFMGLHQPSTNSKPAEWRGDGEIEHKRLCFVCVSVMVCSGGWRVGGRRRVGRGKMEHFIPRSLIGPLV